MLTLTMDDIPADVPEVNRKRWLEVVNALLRRAEPGNAAYWKLVNEFGFQGDFLDADHGEAPGRH